MLKKILLLLCNLVLGLNSLENEVVNWNLGEIRPFNKSIEFALDFYAPTKPGAYPVVVFLTGLNGLAISSFYSEFNTHLVNQSQSILIVFSGLTLVHLPDKEEKYFELTLNWTLDNLNGLFNSEKTPSIIKNLVFPDTKTWGISLLGHSAGCHTVVSYMNSTCGLVKSYIKTRFFFC